MLPDFEKLEDAGLLSKERLLTGDIPISILKILLCHPRIPSAKTCEADFRWLGDQRVGAGLEIRLLLSRLTSASRNSADATDDLDLGSACTSLFNTDLYGDPLDHRGNMGDDADFAPPPLQGLQRVEGQI